MVPEVDVITLQLPSRSTIEYMRTEEMITVSRVQKATVLAAADTVHLGNDGTTLHQIKKAASKMNSVALRIHDVPIMGLHRVPLMIWKRKLTN